MQSILQTRNPEMPILLAPIYWDMRGERWSNAAVKALFTQKSQICIVRTKVACFYNFSRGA
ncbi:MAG: hypothetical protein HY318_16030 [Armatimonadetes bacterium]|nr:hypothetical protein [Armatimonadota bacterium]